MGNAEKARIEITTFFNDIRKVIAERETNLKQKISEQLRKQEYLLKKKEDNVHKHLKYVKNFYDEYQKSLSEKEISLLNTSHRRIEVIKKATMDIEKVDLVTTFDELNKENELNAIWKQLHPGKVPKESLHTQSQGAKNTKGSSVQSNTIKNRGTKELIK